VASIISNKNEIGLVIFRKKPPVLMFEGGKIISNKTNSMNIQSNLNIKYNIYVHFLDQSLYRSSGYKKNQLVLCKNEKCFKTLLL
jgi:hypothetical protein